MTMIDAREAAKFRRQILTPEGIALPVELARRSERATAFVIDLVVQIVSIVAVTLILVLALGGTGAFGGGWIVAFMFLAWFLIRSFYFVFFELRWQGRTPGKKAVGLRVIDRDGGPLTADAVFTRNFMREVEIFLPLSFLVAVPATDAERWTTILALIWASIFLLMPLFNRDAMRVGDMVAGTWVIILPRARLLSDLSGEAQARAPGLADSEALYEFTAEQLAVYGIMELQVLEEVLRSDGVQAEATRREVAARIRAKIGWEPEPGAPYSDRDFLEAFYKALRQHLERDMLFGKRKESKND